MGSDDALPGSHQGQGDHPDTARKVHERAGFIADGFRHQRPFPKERVIGAIAGSLGSAVSEGGNQSILNPGQLDVCTRYGVRRGRIVQYFAKYRNNRGPRRLVTIFGSLHHSFCTST